MRQVFVIVRSSNAWLLVLRWRHHACHVCVPCHLQQGLLVLASLGQTDHYRPPPNRCRRPRERLPVGHYALPAERVECRWFPKLQRHQGSPNARATTVQSSAFLSDLGAQDHLSYSIASSVLCAHETLRFLCVRALLRSSRTSTASSLSAPAVA